MSGPAASGQTPQSQGPAGPWLRSWGPWFSQACCQLLAAWAEVSGAAPLRRRAAAIQAEHLAHGGPPLSEAEAIRRAMAAQHPGDRPRCC